MPDFIDILKNFGVPIALVVFFLWKDWRAELQRNKEKCIADALRIKELDLITKHVSDVESYTRNKLESLVERSILGLNNFEGALNRLADIMGGVIQSNRKLQVSNEEVAEKITNGKPK